MDETDLQIMLRERLEQNRDDMLFELRRRMLTPGVSHDELLHLAKEIYRVGVTYETMKAYPVYGMENLQYLLGYENPLALATQQWPGPNMVSDIQRMQFVLEDFVQEKRAYPDHPSAKEATTGRKGQDRQSLLAGLHKEQEQPAPPRDKRTPSKDGPEL